MEASSLIQICIALCAQSLGSTTCPFDDLLQIGIIQNSDVILHVDDVSLENPDATVSNKLLFNCTEGDLVFATASGPGKISGSSASHISTMSLMLMKQQGQFGINCLAFLKPFDKYFT